MRCPKCNGVVVHEYARNGMRGNKCVACGLYHEIGADRASLDRQVTKEEPAGFTYVP